MDIRLIKTDSDYEKALVEIKRLWNAAPGSADEDKLEVLAMLMHRYEREREPLEPASPIDAIKFRLEQQGLTRKDLLPIFGTTGRTSEVLGGRRPLTLEMIRKLHSHLAIPLESLIQVRPKRRSRVRTSTKHLNRRTARPMKGRPAA